MPGRNLTRSEAARRAELLRVSTYRVSLDLGNAKDLEARTFLSTSTIEFFCAEPGASTFLDLIAPSVRSVTLNGVPLDPAEVFADSRVRLDGLQAENTVTVVADCAYSRTGEGLHRFADPADGRVYLYTQFEPADARRLYANFEQPDLKASFTFDVKAPAGWYIAGNSAPAKRAPVVNGVAHWTFLPTPRISTYITVVVAGPYHVASDVYKRALPDGTTLEIPLNALCRHSLADHFDDEAIFDVTKRGLDFFHEKFDYPYPFGKYDQAFVPEYNLGAMENPGCVTFTEHFVFRSKQTDSAYESRANVILHEMAHMWFGDLVTMRWWDDLWLKESFADFMGSYGSVGATRWKNAWVAFANRRKAWAYRQDQLPSTHPIVATINDLEDAKLNFDGITYAKGASVLKQLVAYVGEDAFIEGSRRYFRQHAFANTTLTDLLSALEETSGRDLSAWSKAWLETSGVNTLTLTDGVVRQQGSPRPHRIAVGAYELGDAGVARVARVELDLERESALIPPDLSSAAFVLVNDDDLSYCKVVLNDAQLAFAYEHLSTFTDPMPRSLIWSSLWNMTRDGVLPGRRFLDFVNRHAAAETEVGVLSNLLDQAGFVLAYYLTDENRAAAREPVAAMARRELRAAQAASDKQLAWARFYAKAGYRPEDLDYLAALLEGTAVLEGLTVDADLRWEFLLGLAAAGAADKERIDAELARDKTASGHRNHAGCLAARPLPEAKADVWRRVSTPKDQPNDLLRALLNGFNRAGQAELLTGYAEPYFESLDRIWAERTIENASAIVSGAFPELLVDPGTLARADEWLAGEHAPALRRLVLEARDDLARALRARAA
ncbi:aminopeptidase N [Actinospica sp. MGRD01-02]|uniref:Aminopeptidase N n=1 Tax=Actinospica acidithermotolerans TaxID=2828514 RepID=A0A941IJ23_9ACTN|nr:aminopeptidase N [Actinospica acidithermotolerans]MBR7827397.1 aminopeptidase N [Actinospica acidithermotolerans]